MISIWHRCGNIKQGCFWDTEIWNFLSVTPLEYKQVQKTGWCCHGYHQDIMISFRRDHTTSSWKGSEITCEFDHQIPGFPHPASWHTLLSPHMACECLAARAAASRGSRVKAKASLSADKWARQDISTETQPKPLEEQTLICIIFLACWILDMLQDPQEFSLHIGNVYPEDPIKSKSAWAKNGTCT